MARRPKHQRHGIRRGQIVDWPREAPSPDEVAARATFTGSSLHKTYASPAGPPASRSDKAKCDVYGNEQWPRLAEALRAAIRSQCTGEFRGEFPERAWAWINDVLHEARLTNQELGEYHGFPIFDSEQYPVPTERLEAAPRVTIAAN